MDKEWIDFDRREEKYKVAARNFVNEARAREIDSDMIVCPCVKCRNLQYKHYDTVYEHLVIKGFDPNYKIWVFHGERPSSSIQYDGVERPNVERPETYRMYEDMYFQNDCCLFRNALEHANECPTCGSSRWKVKKKNTGIRKGVPAKVLRYFPIIPRLKRMFAIAETSEQIRWHSTNKSKDGKLRHPVDSLAWDTIDKKWPLFASDPRNVRFGLSTDGFNPFQDSSYSCWPVILATYNLPPWLCMSKERLMLTLLIPGPRQPGNNIDVYLAPLIDDLKLLWTDGVEVYDAFSKTNFNLKCILMWTINDFPAYGNLSGWPTKGYFACPVCRENTCSDWLKHSEKNSYMGHRRFLAPNHPFRRKKSWFNGHYETERRPRISTSEEIYREVDEIENKWGKLNDKKKKKRKYKDKNSEPLWKKKSIF